MEDYQPPIPEEIQLKVAYWSFPRREDDIQLYCCLAHASIEEFQKAELILKLKNVKDVLQIGLFKSVFLTWSVFRLVGYCFGCVSVCLQNVCFNVFISSQGFHLSGIITNNRCSKPNVHKVAVTFDRCQIISSSCTCHPTNATWCAHISALCLFRIRYPGSVCYRPPISESLSRLNRDQLQKFAQYLINDLPPQVNAQ